MSVKYMKLETEDNVCPMGSTVIDFRSIHNYDDNNYSQRNFKSIFTYSKNHSFNIEREYVLPSIFSRICSTFVEVICYTLVFVGFPVTWWFCFKNVQMYERLVIYRLGRLLPVKESSVAVILPCIDKLTKVDMRMRAFSVPPQKIITGDGVLLEVGADIYFRIKDPALSVATVQDLNISLRTCAVSSLQNVFSKQKLNLIQVDKVSTISLLQAEINQKALTWGAEIGKIELSHISVLEKENSILEAVSGGTNAVEVISQLFSGSASHVPTLENILQPTLKKDKNADVSGGTTSSNFILPQHLIEIARPMLSYDLVNDYKTIFQFVVTGNHGGHFYLDLKNGEGSIGEGFINGNPDVTVTLTIEDMNLLLAGQISAFDAYMANRLKVDGDLRMAMGMQDIVNRIRQQMLINYNL